VALLRADPGDRPIGDRALAAAVRSVVVALAEASPVLVAIDDLQWLDAASSAALAYVLRRLSDERIGLLATRRLGEAFPPALEDLIRAGFVARHPIGPLSMGSLHHLIKERLGHSLARPTLMRVHQASGGNPLFAIEIARALAELGPLRPGQPLPIPADIESLVRTRILRLPSGTREVLLAASALAEPSAALVSEAVGRSVEKELELAHVHGVAELEGGAIRFHHPLFASAIYRAAPATQRRHLHAHLARLVDNEEERARHLALSVSGRDEDTARAVHETARSISLAGAPLASVELLEYALAIGQPDAPTEAQRIYDLADNLARAGDNARAHELLEGVDPWTGWPPRLQGAALDLLLELTYWINGSGEEMTRVGQRLLAGDLPPQVRGQVHAALARYTEDDLPRALDHANAALGLLDSVGDAADPLVRASALAFRARNRLVMGEGLDREDMRRALELEAQSVGDDPGPARAADGFGQWLKYADEIDESRELLETGLARDLDAGYEKGALNKFQHLALTECLAGNLDLALEYAHRSCDLHDLERNRVLGYAWPILAIVEAHRGNAEAVYAVRDMFRAQGNPIHLESALGLLELSLERNRQALVHLSGALQAAEGAGLREPGIYRIHANAAEAAIAIGAVGQAQDFTQQLEAHGRRVGHRWSLATGARCRALLLAHDGALAEALTASDEALVWHQSLPMPFERARTLLVKGVIERRARQRTRSQQSLLEAAQAFERIGARIWAERARSELDRVGLRRASADELTEGERRCAELAATGMTNREVAAALFISPKTVEANLARVYRKLGIGSRAELGSRMRGTLQT
jgi:DNA-binding CsgD family transcriptional regulator